MYIDPNVGGMLFQALAALFAAVTTILLVFARQIRAAFARIRRHYRNQDHRSTSRRDDYLND